MLQSGAVNVLISTSVGEEGLDVGDVDLIIFYDVTASPTRATQRMGRTGRRRQGRIVVLAAEGSELRKYERSLKNKQARCCELTLRSYEHPFTPLERAKGRPRRLGAPRPPNEPLAAHAATRPQAAMHQTGPRHRDSLRPHERYGPRRARRACGCA